MYKRHLSKLTRTRLDDVLIDEGVLPRSAIEDAHAEAEMTGRPLSDVLSQRQEIDEWDLAKIVARAYSLPFVDVAAYDIPRETVELLEPEYCARNLLLPFDLFGGIPALAVCEVPSEAVLEDVERLCGETPFLYVTLRSRLLQILGERGVAVTAPVARAAAGATTATATTAAAQQGAAPPPSAPSLAPASMRLGYSMQRGGVRADASLSTSPPKTPARAGVASDDAPRESAAAGKSGKPTGGAAAWQSIFDLGDDAVEGTDG